jgi:hypothetical protein
VLFTITQQPQQFGAAQSEDAFGAFVDVAGVAIPFAVVVLFVALTWPNARRWLRHRWHRRRRRRHHDGAPAGTARRP